jgi:hypothetical protein
MSLIAEVNAPYYGAREVWVDNKGQSVEKIIEAIQKKHSLDKTDYQGFAKTFWRGTAKDTAQLLFDFHKKYIVYAIEPELDQTVKSPGRIKADRHGDCKHYAQFTCGVCDALNRMGYPIEAWYRFVSDFPDTEVHHVFAVVSDGKKEYWVDPVIDRFDQRPTFYNTKDVHMAISSLSGTIKYDIAQVAGRNPFRNRDHMLRFLQAHNMQPGDFRDADHMKMFILQKLKHHMGDYQAVGRKKRAHNNFLKKIAHGMEVNAHNATKGVKKAVEDVKNLSLKVSLAAGRGPFLAVVATNGFNLAHRLRDTLVGPHRGPLIRKWKDIGGNEHALINAVNSGWRHYKQHHGGYDPGRDHVSGMGYIGDSSIGIIQVAPAMALASGVIALLSKFIHSSAPAHDEAMADAAKKGSVDIAMAANEGVKNDQGGATTVADIPGTNGTMKLATGIDEQGNATVAVHTTAHPLFDQAAQQPAGHDGEDVPGGGAVQKQDSSIDTGMAGKDSFKNFVDNATSWVKEHKTAVVVTAAGVLIGIPVVKSLTGKKKRR